uniref:Carbonic anhydrase 1 n=1 Tax=Dromaius novaehollandiae TaxID=8790 RepID=A0A8C4JF43_DRONO
MANLNWSYQGNNAPDHWHKLYSIANGDHQSPIDIKTKEVKKDASLGHLRITWKPSTCKEIVNVGHSLYLVLCVCSAGCGPLTGNYRLCQFHFHGGQTDDQGSGHTMDGGKEASELHLVHWNSDKYSGRAEAFDKPDGLAVVTVFLKGKQAPLSNFDPASLLPTSLDYWTYNSSLTHPSLHESVIRIILKDSITISLEQVRIANKNLSCLLASVTVSFYSVLSFSIRFIYLIFTIKPILPLHHIIIHNKYL